ncbi:MAG: acyl-CoA synthetase (AMP-forming)/AMP-acid ligase II [Paracoccaceae bacterium]|jgi:acyl-CoA synthetase (AMP-forming)/AMP-acid ligase II
MNLSHIISAHAKRTPNALTISDSHRSLTYDALETGAGELAKWMRQNGVAPGDRGVIVSENSTGFGLLILAIAKAGGIITPLNTRADAHTLRQLVRRTDPALIFATEEFAPLFTGQIDPAKIIKLDPTATPSRTGSKTRRPLLCWARCRIRPPAF